MAVCGGLNHSNFHGIRVGESVRWGHSCRPQAAAYPCVCCSFLLGSYLPGRGLADFLTSELGCGAPISMQALSL